MCHCRSHWWLLPNSCSSTWSCGGFIPGSLCCCELWLIPVPLCLWLLTACLSAHPGVLIFLLFGLLLCCCSVPGRVAARAQHFQVDFSSCLCRFCSWLFTVTAAFHLFCRYPGEEVLCSDSHGTEQFEFCCSVLQPAV